MAEAQYASSAGFKQGWEQLSQPQAFGVGVVLFYALPSLANMLIFDYRRLQGPIELWLILATLGFSVAGVALLLFRLVLLRSKSPEIHPVLTLIIYFTVGMLRGSIVYVVGVELGIVPPQDLSYRVVGGGLSVLIICVTGALIVGAQRQHEAQLRGLSRDRAELQNLRATIRLTIERQRAELVGRVQGLLAPLVFQLQDKISKIAGDRDRTEAVASLQALVDDVVRPLSHRFASDKGDGPDPILEVDALPLVELQFPKRVYVRSMAVPAVVSLGIALSVFSPVSVVHGESVALLAVITSSLFMFGFVWLALRLLRNLVLPTVLAGVFIVAVYVMSAALFRPLVALLPFSIADQLLTDYLLLAGAAGFLGFLHQMLQIQRMTSEERVRETNEELELLISQLRQEVWLNNRNMASILHGPVQASLYASAMRLNEIQEVNEEALATVKRDLALGLDYLKQPSEYENLSFKDVMQQIIDLWDGVCSIRCQISDELLDEVQQNQTLVHSLTEVIREATSNAIKHAKATQIDIRVAKLERGLIEVTVINDGEAPELGGEPGLGTTMLDEITHTWSLDHEAAKTTLRAEIVIPRY